MRALAPFVLLPALLLAAPAAEAHAFVDHAVPAVGSTVHQPPAELRIWFTQPLEAAFSTIDVTDASGASVIAAPAHVDPGNGQLMIVPLKPLAPGRYRVKWHALSVDTHTTTGSFAFEVAP
jgi:copper resistance protein C